MRLYLVQHGEALPENVDPARPLSERGRTDVEKAARFLKSSGATVGPIWHSTKLRAVQTAEILARVLGAKREQKEGFAPNDPIESCAASIQSSGGESLMIVGHLPFLQKLACQLLNCPPTVECIGFRQGGVVCLEKSDPASWRLLWAVIPELLK